MLARCRSFAVAYAFYEISLIDHERNIFMQFAERHLAYLFVFVIGVCLFLCWAKRRKRKKMSLFVDPELLPHMADNVILRNQFLKDLLIVLTFCFGIIALMRPQWGFRWQEVKRQGLDIFVAVDVSKSMLTGDVKPNRLERSKLAIRDLIKKLEGDRIGLIAFAGDAYMVCPLTLDYNGFLLALDDLTPQTVPLGGTALASAIEEAMKSYEKVPSKYKAVIMITDGENQVGDPVLLAKKAKQQGIRIFCIGVGTQEGELIRVLNEQGQHEFLKDRNGNFVKSRLNEGILQEIALTTGGLYIRASGAEFGLDLIYDQRLSKMEKRELKSNKEKKYFERFQIPLGMALLFLVLETVIVTRKK